MKKNHGYALISSLVAIFILGILVFSMLGVSLGGTHLTGHRRDSQVAFDIADAGFQHAYRSICENPNYAGQPSTPFGAGSFSLVVTPGVANTLQVLSMGSVAGGEGINSNRTIVGSINLNGATSLLNYAVSSQTSITTSGSTTITSSPTTSAGNVYSGANLTMSGTDSISGAASSVGTISTSGSASVSSGESQGASTLSFPTVNSSQVLSMAEEYGTTNGDVNVGSGQTTPLQGVINGNVNVSGTGQLVIAGPVYITGNLTMTGNCCSGSGTLFIVGTTTISGNCGASAPNTSNLSICSLSSQCSAISVSGGASVGGFIYAPNGGIDLNGCTVNGGIAANKMTFTGSVSVSRNTSQSAPLGIGTPTIAYWFDESGA